jgi:hypothetical protein
VHSSIPSLMVAREALRSGISIAAI